MKDLEDYFTASSAWACDKCGELIACDYDSMQEHLSDEHNIEVEKP